MVEQNLGNEDQPAEPWAAYTEATVERAPRQFLLKVAERFEEPGFAIDIGCGAGVESEALLRLGWRVLALDREPKAIESVLRRAPEGSRERLETQRVGFEEMRLPPADLIWAGLSLPFAGQGEAAEIWSRILSAVVPGGRIACDLFGERHAWVSEEGMNYVTAESVATSLEGFEIELLEESEAQRKTLFDGMQHWHAFTLIARKR